MQVYRRGHKIFTSWPVRTRLKLKRRWTYQGRAMRLRAGVYTWIVWPAFGTRTNPRYGSMLGRSTFRIVR